MPGSFPTKVCSTAWRVHFSNYQMNASADNGSINKSTKKRIVILGGGFGGVYAALHLEKLLAREPGTEICLVSRDNFILFTPMLHEIAASDLDVTNIVNPLRKLLRRVEVFVGDVRQIDLPNKQVVVSHGHYDHCHRLQYDHLVIALGSVTNFFNLPGLAELALTMKSLPDAIRLRARIIRSLEDANAECSLGDRQSLLTFVVAGGGFAGVETIAALNDFVREALPLYPNLNEDMLRVVLVHPGAVILPELGESLGRYAQKVLAQRGVEIRLNTRVTSMTENEVCLNEGPSIPSSAPWFGRREPCPTHCLLRFLARRSAGASWSTNFSRSRIGRECGPWAIARSYPMRVSREKLIRPPRNTPFVKAGSSRKISPWLWRAVLHGHFASKPSDCLLPLAEAAPASARIFGLNFSGFFAWVAVAHDLPQ